MVKMIPLIEAANGSGWGGYHGDPPPRTKGLIVLKKLLVQFRYFANERSVYNSKQYSLLAVIFIRPSFQHVCRRNDR